MHAERYSRPLKAPRKELIWFGSSAHFFNTEEAVEYNALFVERLMQEAYRPDIHGVSDAALGGGGRERLT